MSPLTDQVVSAPLVLVNDTVVVATTDEKIRVVKGLSSGNCVKENGEEGGFCVFSSHW